MAGPAGLGDQGGDGLDGVAASNVDADAVGDLDGRAEAFEALDLVGPHARFQPPRLQRVADVDRVGVEADRRDDRRVGRGTGTSPRVEHVIVTVEPVVTAPPGS